jgi:hypothetical protein
MLITGRPTHHTTTLHMPYHAKYFQRWVFFIPKGIFKNWCFLVAFKKTKWWWFANWLSENK